MNEPITFDPAEFSVGLDRELLASLVPDRPDPPVPVDGATFGVATMTENSPHGGEMHPDGDEILFLISGHINVVFLDDPMEDIEVKAGGGLVVPKGMWHRVDVLAPSQIAYVTPGPNNEFRPLSKNA